MKDVSKVITDRTLPGEIERQETLYGYYMVHHEPTPKTMPSGYSAVVSLNGQMPNDWCGCNILGWVAYGSPLTVGQVTRYELVPDEDNLCRWYERYRIERATSVIGADHKRSVRHDWLTNPDGSEFETTYMPRAIRMVKRLNDEAWAHNSEQSITKYYLRTVRAKRRYT